MKKIGIILEMKNIDVIVPGTYNLSGNIRKIIKNYSDFKPT